MRRALLVPALAATLALGACGGTDGDSGGNPAPKADATGQARAAAAPSGFEVTRGKGWSFALPAGFQRLDATPPAGSQLQVYELDPGDRALPSQVTVGASTKYTGSLGDAVAVGKTVASSKYNGYEAKGQKPVTIAGAKAVRVDATYQSFEAEPRTVRSVNLYVRSKKGLQLNLSVRGPDDQFERLGLERIVASLRVR